MKCLPAVLMVFLLASCAAAPAAMIAAGDHGSGMSVPAEGAAALIVKGPGGETLTLTVNDLLAELPQASIDATIHGETHLYEGPLLADVLARAGAPVGQPMHGAPLRQAVIVTCRDGYQVVFALAELDLGLSADRILLATSKDGTPLSDGEGPFRIIVENAARAARSARMVSSIEVRALE